MSTPDRHRIRLVPVLGIAALMATAALAIGLTLPASPRTDPPLTISLSWIVAIAMAAELASIDRRIGGHAHSLSLSEVGLVIGLAFAAPAHLVVGRVVAAGVVLGGIKRVAAPKLAFDTALFALETIVAAAVYQALLGAGVVPGVRALAALVIAVAACSLVGLGAVRAVLRLHGITPRADTAVLSAAISVGAALIGIGAVVALSVHAAAALLIAVVCGVAFFVMRAASRRFGPADSLRRPAPT